ncbi:MAG: phosphodiester glycosidase family protein [Saccharofermentanales bacterium]
MKPKKKARNHTKGTPIRNKDKVGASAWWKYISAFIAVVLAAGLFLLYGPFAGFRNFWISTAMNTASHQYLAQIFYSDMVIAEVMAGNTVIEPDENTSTGGISEVSTTGQIQLVKIDRNGCTGNLLIIDDPARVSVEPSASTQGMILEEMTAAAGGIASINASGYLRIEEPGVPTGLLISGSETVYEGKTGSHNIIGFDIHNNLILGNYSDAAVSALNLRDAVEFGPFLIINGTRSVILGNGGGYAPRSAIGQTASGAVLFLVLDGRTLGNIGATLRDVQDIMAEHGAINAANLDGGSSVSMIYQGKLVNTPTSIDKHRILPCCFIVR